MERQKLATIINALECSADEAFIDVIDHGYKVKRARLAERIEALPPDEQEKVFSVLDGCPYQSIENHFNSITHGLTKPHIFCSVHKHFSFPYQKPFTKRLNIVLEVRIEIDMIADKKHFDFRCHL